MRLASLLLLPIALASPALADEPATSSPVVVLRGSSAPPTPWYEPPPEPTVVIQPVYVPMYYLPFAYGPILERPRHAPAGRRNR